MTVLIIVLFFVALALVAGVAVYFALSSGRQGSGWQNPPTPPNFNNSGRGGRALSPEELKQRKTQNTNRPAADGYSQNTNTDPFAVAGTYSSPTHSNQTWSHTDSTVWRGHESQTNTDSNTVSYNTSDTSWNSSTSGAGSDWSSSSSSDSGSSSSSDFGGGGSGGDW